MRLQEAKDLVGSVAAERGVEHPVPEPLRRRILLRQGVLVVQGVAKGIGIAEEHRGVGVPGLGPAGLPESIAVDGVDRSEGALARVAEAQCRPAVGPRPIAEQRVGDHEPARTAVDLDVGPLQDGRFRARQGEDGQQRRHSPQRDPDHASPPPRDERRQDDGPGPRGVTGDVGAAAQTPQGSQADQHQREKANRAMEPDKGLRRQMVTIQWDHLPQREAEPLDHPSVQLDA